MPTYEYDCPEGHAFEKFQKITEKPRAKCPVCGKSATRKISGGAGLVFRGSGFYITDYGKDGKGPRKADTERSGGDKPAETKSESPAKDTKSNSESTSPKPSTGKGGGKAPKE
jgi:putative FmdB family regulatory protein